MFEIRIICATQDLPRVAQAVLGSVDAVSVRRFPARDHTRTRVYVTAEQRGSHDECTACPGDGIALWLLPDGSEQRRPCTGLGSEALHAAGLTACSRQREPWHRNADQ
ncbi:hypothetical protein ACIRPU_16910 [Streptomyces sp. NPDC102259]|uniref:hypothetical protein n=1 Tax=Streptomyces sp. NPDC102259 TaxID=3366148 RepID=UPI00381C0471